MPTRIRIRRSNAAIWSAFRRGDAPRPLAALVAGSLVAALLMVGAPFGAPTAFPAAAAAAADSPTVAAARASFDGAARARGPIAKLAAGNPGVPSAPTTLFQEGFENNPVNTPVLLTSYVGAGGQTYTAANPWLTSCNGIIASHSMPASSQGNCGSLGSSENLRQLVYALGVQNGTPSPTNNRAVAAYTENNPGADQIEFATVNPISLPSANGRFLTFSVNAAAKNCPPVATAPLYNFSLVSAGGTTTPVGGQINACSSATTANAPTVGSTPASAIRVGTYTSNGSVLLSGSTVGIRMTNANGSGVGNDAAFDDIRILDVTPQLDKSFSPATRFVGQSATLTFTVTNTSELAAKSGWGFTDALPSGLLVAPFPNLGGTCAATRTAAAGATSITVTGGTLAAGQTSCTITVDVAATAAGSYTNGPANVTPVGLNLPGSTTVQFFEPDLPIVTCTSDPNIFNTGYNAATGGVLANGAFDANWQVAGGFDGYYHPTGTTPPSLAVLPPANAVWAKAEVGNAVPAAWVASPTGNAQWISAFYAGAAQNQREGSGDWYYRFQFTMGAGVDPSAFALTMKWYADNSVAGVWVNGVAQTGANLPQDPVTPYISGGFLAGAEATTVLDDDWQTGTNTIIVQIKSFWSHEGFNAQVVPTPLCADYADAPNSYGTARAQNGPAHALISGLTLGAAVDAELDGQPTAGADGDDVADVDDEDAVAAPIVISPGDTTTVSVSATNTTAQPATLAGWIDLNGNGVFDTAERVVVPVPANSGTANYSLVFPAGTVTANTYARFRLYAGTVAAPVPTGLVSGGEVEDYRVTFTDRELEIEKTSTQTAASRPGDVVTYTVTATNVGTASYTAATPAVVYDDIRSVLDDATYNGDASATTGPVPSYIAPGFLSWRGPLAPGASVTIEYSVTLAAGGDGVVRNVAWQPGEPPAPGTAPTTVPACDPPTAQGDDPVTGEECAATENLLPRLTVDKTASVTDLPSDGGTVTYTVVVTNVGPGDFTAAAPATLSDDLSEVLDDATYNDDVAATVGTADVSAGELSWEGALAAGQSATLTYSVTYDASAGDNVLVNVACVPEGDALDPDAACDFVQIPAAALVMTKSVDPADGTSVVAGQQVTYTLSFENVGQTLADVDALDTLTDVLDDATLTAGPTAAPGLTATLSGDELAVTGQVPVGQTLTVTYTVTVDDFADQGDHVLANLLSEGDGSCPPLGCPETENPVRHFTVEKTVDPAAPAVVNPGDEVTYTVTLTNDGTGAYTAATPASISDDLSAVLDDAALTGAPTASLVGQPGATLPAPSFAAPTLAWAGPLAVGETVEITYTVTVGDPRTGDGALANIVSATAPGGECLPDACATSTDLQFYTVSKSASTTTAGPGDTVVYTLVVTNESAVAYTAAAPASISDDLSGVLDDATYNGDATNGATVTGTTLAWQGALAPGASVVIVYSVTVDDPTGGDDVLANVATADGPGGECVPDQCATTTGIQSYTVSKAASSDTVVPGATLTYTVTVENTGTVPYTAGAPASFTDDLSDVLDDATFAGTATNGATLSGTTLTWAGPLAVGETIAITYSVVVDDPVTGDDVLTNEVAPTGPGGGCPDDCTTETPVQSYTVSKTASAASVQLGGTITYTVVLENTGAVDYTAAAPASFSDDLSGVLDDATYNDDATAGAVVTGSTLTWAGPLAAGESIQITYSVTVNDPATGDDLLSNAVVPTAAGGACDPSSTCETTTPVQSFSVVKTADAATVVPGDTITYTLTITNTGAAAYTAASPAVLNDDLSALLDDATYNGDATGGATYAAPVLTWSGALAVGEVVTVTYSVTVDDPVTGDSRLDNVVVTENGGTCPDGSLDPACTVRIPSGSFTVSKTASATTVLPGDVVTYTVSVVNTGAVDYTAAVPASFTDDLAAVLDDATYNDDASAGASVTGTTLTWSGALAIGAQVDITYSVTVNAPNTGDGVLANAVAPLADGGACVPDACATSTLVQSYTVAKTASTTVAVPGDTVTYTVTIVNTGAADYPADAPASFSDDLSAVLDDATYNGDATGGASVTAGILTWTGALPAGQTVTITYSVTVDDPGTGDDVLTNAVTPTADGGTCDPAGVCETETPVQSYSVSKEVSAATAVPGGTLTYTVTVTNTGAVDYTAAAPASFTDDLSAVLDDATYNDDATSGATFTAPILAWTGALAAGGEVVITYSVTVDDPNDGDDVLTNAVVPTAVGGDCLGSCTTTTGVRSYTVEKSSSATTVEPGGVVTYTVTVVNTGSVDYTAAAPASFTDDLSDVLDDATYNDDATNGATVTGTTLAWAGALAAGASIDITYSVTVDDPGAGDDVLDNVVTADGPGGDCLPDACATSTAVRSYTVTKRASTTTVEPGGTVSFTITVTNTGAVDYTADAPASFTDDLSDVLDDATYNGDATGGAGVTGSTLAWSGALAVGASVDITYSVTVGDPNTGDDVIANIVVADGPGGGCAANCSTTTAVRSFTVAKSASATSVQPGGTVTYTVTVTNTGAVDYTAASPAAFTDDLSDVLDDATYNGDATNGATVVGPTLTWAGALAAGAQIDITYSVTANDPGTGDDLLTNTVAPTAPGGACAPDACATTTPVQSFSVTKTADAVAVVPGETITYTLTITNTGQAAYTAASPATLTDDLSDVLDDATYNGDATGGATYAAPVLAWAGALAVGEVITITYSVTVDDPVTGDSRIVNAVVTENGGNCGAGSTDAACVVSIPSGSFTVAKSASATTARPGDVVTYTVTVANTGGIAYTDDDPASFEDSLANVLDDATYNDDASNGATVTGTLLAWEGALDVGETITITYSVTVNDAGVGAGDLDLGNIVVATAPGGACDPEAVCATNTPIAQFQVSKTSSGDGVVNEGEVVTYSVTIVNVGGVDFTADAPASFTDDLSAVLDDATYNDDATGGAIVQDDTLTWSGPLAVGETITITYSVTVGAAGDGDGELVNAVSPGDAGACVDDCTTTDALQAYTVEKSSSTTDGTVEEGEVLTYTITVVNTGAVDYTAADPATFTDDLTAVLDDATYNDDASSGATVVGSTLTWSGAVPSGSSLQITYSVTALAAGSGDGVLTNAVIPTAIGGECAPQADCSTSDALRSFTVEKAASTTTVDRGATVVYTIVVTNTGAAAFTADAPARVTDDLTAVLDDADYNGDATNGAVYDAPELSWALALPVGGSVTLTYSVTVDDDPAGDLALVNAVTPGAGGTCAADACTTETPVSGYSVSKAVDVTRTALGSVVTYTISIVNDGAVAFTDENPATFADDLSDVLDDGAYNGDATNGATYDEPVLVWAGALDVGETTTVTYSVTVDNRVNGDRQLENAVLPGAGGDCRPVCTVTTVVEVPSRSWLAVTGLDGAPLAALLGLAALASVAGVVLLLGRRHRDTKG